MEQTAVEWLTYKFYANEGIMKSEWLEQAKEIEKQQIIDSYIECKRQYIIKESCFPPQFVVKEAEQYYNKTFKSE